jgi:putative oxidoreductase
MVPFENSVFIRNHGRGTYGRKLLLTMGIRDITLLAGRAVLGGYLAAHGAQKLFGAFGGHGIEPTAAAFERLGLRPGRVTATAAGLSELGGGLLTVAGLASPAGPAATTGTMAVASATHRANGPFAANRGYELAATNLAAALTLAATGPGRYSLDGLTGLRLPRVLTGLVVAGAVAGAAVNVAMLLRAAPPQPASAAPAPAAAEAGTQEDVTR